MSSKLKRRTLNYVKGVVIVHGLSELQIVEYISSNLHLNIKIESKDKGKHSIQITSLNKHLNTKKFRTIDSFLKEYDVECIGNGKNRKLINFHLYIIMDTDDCSEGQKNDYISKSLFQNHWLYDYIVPIYNTINLEEVMLECNITTQKIKCGDKGKYYNKIFPINKKPLSNDTIKEIRTLKEKLEVGKRKNHTNMTEFIDYCLSFVESESCT